jgi:hypothetical protein
MTTFDGSPGDEGDSAHQLVADGVYRLLRTIPATPDDRLHILVSLLAARKAWLEREVSMERLFNSPKLPPSTFNYLMVDSLLEPENEVVSTYLLLINALEEGIAKVERKIREKNIPSFASDLA